MCWNTEWVVRPPSNIVAAIPDEASARQVLYFELIVVKLRSRAWLALFLQDRLRCLVQRRCCCSMAWSSALAVGDCLTLSSAVFVWPRVVSNTNSILANTRLRECNCGRSLRTIPGSRLRSWTSINWRVKHYSWVLRHKNKKPAPKSSDNSIVIIRPSRKIRAK